MATMENAPSTRRSASFHPLGDGALQGARHQVDDAFGVAGGLEDRAALDQLAAQLVGIGDVAVMGDRRAAHGELAEEGLHVADRGRALGSGGGIAHVADGERPGQRLHHLLAGEIVAHIAEAAGRVEARDRVVGDDPAGLLAAVLQRMQAERHEIGRVDTPTTPNTPHSSRSLSSSAGSNGWMKGTDSSSRIGRDPWQLARPRFPLGALRTST
jgi:hypothetical protein